MTLTANEWYFNPVVYCTLSLKQWIRFNGFQSVEQCIRMSSTRHKLSSMWWQLAIFRARMNNYHFRHSAQSQMRQSFRMWSIRKMLGERFLPFALFLIRIDWHPARIDSATYSLHRVIVINLSYIVILYIERMPAIVHTLHGSCSILIDGNRMNGT